MKWRHGGNIRSMAELTGMAPEAIIDFSASINPLGPPEWLRMAVSRAVSGLIHYPDPDCIALKKKICQAYGVSASEVAVGNGSSELLYHLPRALGIKTSIIPVPSYVDYIAASEASGCEIESVMLDEARGFEVDFDLLDQRISSSSRGRTMVMLGHPNNPTGRLLDVKRLKKSVHDHPDVFFVIDEAFGDFVDGFESLVFERPPNVIVLKSMTKIFSVPGIRLGFLMADPEIIKSLEKIMPPWRVGGIGLSVAEEAFSDDDFIPYSRKGIGRLRNDLFSMLSSLDYLKVYEGCANYLLVKIRHPSIDALGLAEKLAESSIAIRVCDNFTGLGNKWFRIAVRSQEDNTLLYESVRKIFGLKALNLKKRKRPCLMIQGTASNAGKSIITAALCRIMADDGIRVAPFKAQNMSLNSFVTKDGFEIATAQALQAKACRIDPDVRMNPVLVKPSSDVAGQIIIKGKPLGKIDASAYFAFREKALDAVRRSFDSLSEEYDAIIIEGAGSPAEVNLKKNDIVNMSMALYACAPVLMAGDIDRGGVFASFLGSMETFTEPERKMVAGFIVNKFRGDESLLSDAFDYVEKYTGKKTLGVIPYIADLMLPEEDSVNLSNALWNSKKERQKTDLDICIINLPHFSNFTDFDAFQVEDDVFLRIVNTPDEIGSPDALIIPGSKNVISDLRFLDETGLSPKIRHLASGDRCLIIGICGGYQMLGITVEDPSNIESDISFHKGLGLIDARTVLHEDKKLKRIKARHLRSGETIEGYEIHHGVTISNEKTRVLETDGHGDPGSESICGNVSGVYMHGFFDTDGFRRWFLNSLRIRKGLAPYDGIRSHGYLVEKELGRLSDIVRSSLDMGKIYGMMGL